MTKKKGYGSVPPDGLDWRMGRTVREVKAIREEAVATGKTPSEVVKLEAWKARLPKA